MPAGKLVHAILDNYAAHKHPKVRAWLARHPRWTFHFTPTSCSWVNAVETFFATLTRRRLQRGAFHSLVDLQAAINRYLAEHNQRPKPFVWTADPDRIIAKVAEGIKRLRQTTSPLCAGALLAASGFGWPLLLAGSLKIAYDLCPPGHVPRCPPVGGDGQKLPLTSVPPIRS